MGMDRFNHLRDSSIDKGIMVGWSVLRLSTLAIMLSFMIPSLNAIVNTDLIGKEAIGRIARFFSHYTQE
jgi:hypothetical protein